MGATSEKLRNHIPYDLTFFILSKLPSKSLKKFGCVHKLWTLVFQNLYFMSMFHNNFISNNHSYCDVLSLLRRPTMSSILSGFNSSLFSLSGHSSNLVEFVPPNEDPHIVLDGFGYMRGRDDYKVIIRQVHFIQNEIDKDEECLVSFDLSNEVFFPTHFPLDIPSHMYDSFDFHVVRRQLVLLNESIVLISNYADTNICYTLILGELGVKESWTKFFIVGPLAFIGEPIGVGKKDEIFFRKKTVK
ncbi:hypothetical protein D0Y65_047354 [Glycine soja]|uniref:F-box domain-containing protein n=1 Tax=Glycine soja TaxID=3848 RepID=A0A445FNJ9_GLYSO|nr:hypothetical protein D0Y65_047354 [Glycine soja]